MKTLVSFVIPCYRSEATLPGVIAEIRQAMEKLEDYTYEAVLAILPGSTWQRISGSTAP